MSLMEFVMYCTIALLAYFFAMRTLDVVVELVTTKHKKTAKLELKNKHKESNNKDVSKV